MKCKAHYDQAYHTIRVDTLHRPPSSNELQQLLAWKQLYTGHQNNNRRAYQQYTPAPLFSQQAWNTQQPPVYNNMIPQQYPQPPYVPSQQFNPHQQGGSHLQGDYEGGSRGNYQGGYQGFRNDRGTGRGRESGRGHAQQTPPLSLPPPPNALPPPPPNPRFPGVPPAHNAGGGRGQG